MSVALILNLLIKWARRVGERPISACTGPSKQPIPALRPNQCLNKKQQKITDSYYVIIHGFRKQLVPCGFFKLSMAVSSERGPGILSCVR